MRDVLVINTYGGSLLLGAKVAGLPIRGSYEDCGFGSPIQHLNFPGVKFCDNLPWPAGDDLHDTIVIAHPPCASFSNMNIVKEKRGVDTGGFECHRKVMDYAMGLGCLALAIESVPGVLVAKGEYAAYAERYGYSYVMLHLNSVSFGVPQWRPRIWTLFFNLSAAPVLFSFKLEPRYVPLSSVLTGEPSEDHLTRTHVQRLKRKYEAAKFDFEAMMRSEHVEPGGFDRMAKQWFLNMDPAGNGVANERLKELTGTVGCWRAGLPRKLDPRLWAPVILGFTLWYVGDRPLNQIEYQRIMGFPDDYKWPAREGKDFMTYLSKGVCPPVATWVLQQVTRNLGAIKADFTHSGVSGDVIDLQPSKAEVEAVLTNSISSRMVRIMTDAFTKYARPARDEQALVTSLSSAEGPGELPSAEPREYLARSVTFSDRPKEGDVFRWTGNRLELELRLR